MSATETIPGVDSLPDDASLLKEMMEGLYSKLEKKEQIIERLKHELLLLRHFRFGRKSEKLAADGQLALFGQTLSVAVEAEAVSAEAKPEDKAKRKGHGRQSLPADLPVERVVSEPSAEELVCQPCGSEKIRIGEEMRRELDYHPGSAYIREIVRPVYACPNACEGQVTVAENRNDSPIEKGLPGPGLLALVVTTKYADHIPLNRQEAMLSRMGVQIARSTMCGWMAEGAHMLTAFASLMREEVLRSEVLHTDDTPVEVQDPSGKRGVKTGRLWVYRGDRKHPSLFYQFSPNHRREWPEGVLSGWRGSLQADAFPGYNALFTN
ncbi:MAG: IS66 family transposase, partial [Planctomycetota bacterium]|nr:IS66 family transposase [Planctomycetota bacterium]